MTARLDPAPSPAHPLDHPVWSALTTRHRPFAEGGPAVWRYPAQVAPFAALPDGTPGSFQALAALAVPGVPLALVQAEAIVAPAPFETLMATTIDQMLGRERGPMPGYPDRGDLLRLDVDDVPEMMALVELTRPGPFGPRTLELGTYLGVRDGNRLVAMAGERMGLDGFTEISAVCTHPDHRGRGHARALMTALIRAVTTRGEVPFLHCLSDNASAIGLYHELGFTLRTRVHFTLLRRQAEGL